MNHMGLELVPEDSNVLHEKCDPFNPRSPDSQTEMLVTEMFIAMQENGGIGLAAPQVGINKRVFIMRVEEEDFICINPSILKSSKETDFLAEGCLSFPGKQVMVERSVWVRVRYQTITGMTKTVKLSGMKARCFQHELDHINGIVFTDRGEAVDVAIQHSRSAVQ